MTPGEAVKLRGFMTAVNLLAQRNQPERIPAVVEQIVAFVRERTADFDVVGAPSAARPQS